MKTKHFYEAMFSGSEYGRSEHNDHGSAISLIIVEHGKVNDLIVEIGSGKAPLQFLY